MSNILLSARKLRKEKDVGYTQTYFTPSIAYLVEDFIHIIKSARESVCQILYLSHLPPSGFVNRHKRTDNNEKHDAQQKFSSFSGDDLS